MLLGPSKFKMSVFYIAVISITICISICQANVKIKIVEPPSSTHFQSYSSSAKKLSLRVDPAPLSGPTYLHALNGECFKEKEKGYEYTVCPFQNVTQKEERSSWNSFHGVLGVWREWIVENDTLIGLHFTLGEKCGLSDREANVMLNCSTNTRLHSMSEPRTCVYTIWMDTPLACFKGAMQVYHLLTDEQLKDWNNYESEYVRGEITFQGLAKKRREILIEADLLRPYDDSANEKTKASTDSAPLHPLPHASTTAPETLTSCEKEKERLARELEMLQEKVNRLVNGYPSISRILGFTANNGTVNDNEHMPTTAAVSPTYDTNYMNRSTQAEIIHTETQNT